MSIIEDTLVNQNLVATYPMRLEDNVCAKFEFDISKTVGL
jgi:hypothetical protein